MLNEHYVKLGPVRTRYFEAGHRSAPVVVLIHEGGYGGDAPNTFGRVVPHLVDKYRVVMPEMLGFGGTDKAVFFGENPYEPRLRHLAAFFDALDLQQMHVVGNSFGGGVTLRMTLRPETAWRMRSAASISGTGGPFRTQEGMQGAFEYTPSLEEAHRLDSWILGDAVPDDEHAQDRFDSSMRPGQWESMMAARLRNPSLPAAPKAIQWDLPAALSASKTPTLLVAGSEDRMLEAGWELKLAEHINDVAIERLETSHSPNISHPELAAKTLRAFFERIEQRG